MLGSFCHIKLHPFEQEFSVLMTQWKQPQAVEPCTNEVESLEKDGFLF